MGKGTEHKARQNMNLHGEQPSDVTCTAQEKSVGTRGTQADVQKHGGGRSFLARHHIRRRHTRGPTRGEKYPLATREKNKGQTAIHLGQTIAMAAVPPKTSIPELLRSSTWIGWAHTNRQRWARKVWTSESPDFSWGRCFFLFFFQVFLLLPFFFPFIFRLYFIPLHSLHTLFPSWERANPEAPTSGKERRSAHCMQQKGTKKANLDSSSKMTIFPRVCNPGADVS
jgi:hypothetical protein